MGRKILLIEDDRETASYLTKGLNQEGHSVEQATNGQDGPPTVASTSSSWIACCPCSTGCRY